MKEIRLDPQMHDKALRKRARLTWNTNSAFKDNQHEQREEGVVPIFVQAPKRDTEYLKNEERGRRMLSK